jgi:hypothetical protein
MNIFDNWAGKDPREINSQLHAYYKQKRLKEQENE